MSVGKIWFGFQRSLIQAQKTARLRQNWALISMTKLLQRFGEKNKFTCCQTEDQSRCAPCAPAVPTERNMHMKNNIFRKSAMDHMSSPEDLNDYIHVARPSVWVVLGAIVALLAGAIAWAVLGRIDGVAPIWFILH